ncbi:MAG: hypothetical protein ACR2H3_08085 [Acidimicrobiales bacterium]
MAISRVRSPVSTVAEIWLSVEAARGVLPGLLDDEGVRWRTVQIG